MATINKLSSSSCSSIPLMKPNPSARNSESKDPMRRSFSGNPFAKPSSIVANSRDGFHPNTPANSPSDFTRRSSFGRENQCSLPDYEDKENNKGSNLRPGRVRSPTSVSKGTKNFMSPTISAASKFTASPRKKILIERNELHRSPIPLSEVKGQVKEDNNVKPGINSTKKKTVSFSGAIDLLIEDDLSNPEMAFEVEKIEASHDTAITDKGHNEALTSDLGFYSEEPLDLKNDLGSSRGTVTDCVNLSPTFKISPRDSSSTISHADPSMPPYDPKTNYLSPRPQFLHYRPNPRIEVIHWKDGDDGKRLKESFMAEHSSKSEASENLSDDDSQKESEDISSDELVQEKDASAKKEEELNISKTIPISTHKPKSKLFTRLMFIPLLLALLSISVTDSTVTDLSMLQDVVALSNLYVPAQITGFAKVKFEELAKKSRLWASNSLSYACKLISELRGVHKLGPLQYGNLTSLVKENHLVDGYPKFGHAVSGAEFKYQEHVLAPKMERDVRVDEPLAESLLETEANEDIEEVSEEEDGEEFEEKVDHAIDEVHANIDQVAEDHTEAESEDVVHANIDEVVEDQSEAESEEASVTPPAEEIEPVNSEAAQTKEISVETYVDNDAKLLQSNIDVADQTINILYGTEIQTHVENDVLKKAEENSENTELDASVVDTPQASATVDNFLTKIVVGISSIVLLGMLAVIVFRTKKAKLTIPSVVTALAEQSVITKKLDYSPISVSVGRTLQEKLAAASSNLHTEVDDMILGESCPSETTSSLKSSSHKEASGEAQSQERRKYRRNHYKRESIASSDISLSSSYSYGSFTTYEKIPSKHDVSNDDNKVVTPVRRSSRIRKQVTSPP